MSLTINLGCSQLPWGFPGGSLVKNLPAKQETRVWSPRLEDPLEKEMVTHSSILAWKTPWTENPDGVAEAGHDLATKQQQYLPIEKTKAKQNYP